MRPKSYWIKWTITTLALVGETYWIIKLLTNFVSKGNFFTIDPIFSIQIIGIMLLTMYTMALTVGAWDKMWHILVTSILVSITIFLALLQYNATYAIILGIGSFLLLVWDTYRSFRLKNLIIKFDPIIILRYSSRGLLFIFSIMAGILIILDTTTVGEINVGQKVAEVAEVPLKNAVESQINSNVIDSIVANNAGVTQLPADAEEQLRNLGITNLAGLGKDILIPQDKVNTEVKTIIENQVNDMVQPYKNFVRPIIAILVYGMFQLYATVTYILFTLTVWPLFSIAKSSGLIKKELVMVEKEELTF